VRAPTSVAASLKAPPLSSVIRAPLEGWRVEEGRVELTPNDVVETETSRTWREPSGLVVQIVKDGAEIDLESANRDLDASLSLLGEGTPRVLVNAIGCKGASRPARQLFMSAANDRFEQTAIVTGNGLADVIGNFWLQLSKSTHTHSIRLFQSEPDARKWLRERPL
jgi:hypothetical protein